MDDELLLRHIFWPLEYRPFFSISAVFEVLGKSFSTFFWTHIDIQFELQILWLWKYICLYLNVLNDNSEFLKGRGLLVVTYKMHYVGTTFTCQVKIILSPKQRAKPKTSALPWRWTLIIKFWVALLLTSNILMY